MFDSVAVAVAGSPRRSRLAGPVSALAHGLLLAGFIGAALWNAADLVLPSPPERIGDFPIPVAMINPSGGGDRGAGGPGLRPKGRATTPSRAGAVPSRLPDEIATTGETEWTDGQGPQRGAEGEPDGSREPGLPGACPTCTGTGTGDKGDVVDGTLVAPILVTRVEPAYPEALRKLRLEGRVLLEAIIGTNGSIEEIRVVSSGNVLFTEEAVKAVSQWRYEPCLLAGRPVRVRLRVTVVFRLN